MVKHISEIQSTSLDHFISSNHKHYKRKKREKTTVSEALQLKQKKKN